ALQPAAPIAIVFVPDQPLELLLALGLLRVGNRDRRARVVAEGAVAAATELELDQILLQLDQRDGDRVAGAQRRAVAFEMVAILREVDRLPRVGLDVYAVGRARHV